MSLHTDFADIEIRILKKEAAGYPVEIAINHEQQFERGLLSVQFASWSPGLSLAEDSQRISDWLLADAPIRQALTHIGGRYPKRRIHLRIDPEAVELHALPWELLRDGVGESDRQPLAAAAGTPFSRYLAGTWTPGSPIFQRPIKMLVVMANPANLTSFGLQPIEIVKEFELLNQIIDGSEIQTEWYPYRRAQLEAMTTTNEAALVAQPCTLEGLESELRKGYHLLHFIGHGKYSENEHRCVVYMADAENNVRLVYDEEFGGMLARQLNAAAVHNDDKLRLVFLAACQTARASPDENFHGFAPALINAGMPAVLAMQNLVSVETARHFARTFYQRLLEHGQVDLACNEARSSILSADLSGLSNPILFMRLRNGLLFEKEGRISSRSKEQFWPFLLQRIYEGRCTPFLGPRVNNGLLPDAATAARTLAAQYQYPLPDTHNLARVIQYMALMAGPDMARDQYLNFMEEQLRIYLKAPPVGVRQRRFQKRSFSHTVQELDWAANVLNTHENVLHHLLAKLELPLYATTNFDNFMVEALKRQGFAQVRQIGIRWSQTEAERPQFLLPNGLDPEQPVVLHLNGFEGDPEQQAHLVLSEDSYLDHFVRIKSQQDEILPMNILEALAENSFLLLGYEVTDWEFRLVVQGLLASIAQMDSRHKLHVGVQLGAEQEKDAAQIIDYLERYLGQFQLEIYWGSPQKFAVELDQHWQRFMEQHNGH